MTSVIIPSSPNDKKTVKDAVVEMSNSMVRQDSERELQRDICVKIKDEVGLNPKYLKRLAKVYHKQNFTEVQSESEDFETLYEEIVK